MYTSFTAHLNRGKVLFSWVHCRYTCVGKTRHVK